MAAKKGEPLNKLMSRLAGSKREVKPAPKERLAAAYADLKAAKKR